MYYLLIVCGSLIHGIIFSKSMINTIKRIYSSERIIIDSLMIPINVNKGVLQVLVTSPILFNLYINDLLIELVEITIEVPMRSEIIFNRLIIKMKDKIIETKVIENDKAKEKYNDAISSGNTGIASSYDINKKVCSLKIGNLPPNEILTLNYSFIQFINIKDSFYYLNLIKDFPSINNFNSEILKGKIIIETSSAINDLQCLTDSNKLINYNPVYSKENKKCEIEYDIKLLNKILFKTLNIEKPLFISQYNNKLDETNYILNYYNNMDNPDKIKYPCLFIFLIDQSGSMRNTINNVKITLTKLIQSLPKNSYYQIIGFGSKYEVYNKDIGLIL